MDDDGLGTTCASISFCGGSTTSTGSDLGSIEASCLSSLFTSPSPTSAPTLTARVDTFRIIGTTTGTVDKVSAKCVREGAAPLTGLPSLRVSESEPISLFVALPTPTWRIEVIAFGPAVR